MQAKAYIGGSRLGLILSPADIWSHWKIFEVNKIIRVS